MVLRAQIENMEVSMLVDTGASINALNVSTFELLSPLPTLVNPSHKTITTVDGSASYVYGELATILKIHDTPFPLHMQVMNCGKHDAILGRPFLSNYKAIIKSHENTISLTPPTPHKKFTISLQNNEYLMDPVCAKLAQATILPPFSETHTYIYPTDDDFLCATVLTEGINDVIDEYNIAIAATISTFNSPQLICRIMNPSAFQIFLPQHLQLATLTPLPENGIISTITPAPGPEPPVVCSSPPPFDIDHENLTSQQTEQLLDTLHEYSDIFAYHDNQLGCTSQIQHKIDVGVNKPIKSAPYRLNPENRQNLKAHITEMLDLGIIRESHSPWASPIVLVKKQDNTD